MGEKVGSIGDDEIQCSLDTFSLYPDPTWGPVLKNHLNLKAHTQQEEAQQGDSKNCQRTIPPLHMHFKTLGNNR